MLNSKLFERMSSVRKKEAGRSSISRRIPGWILHSFMPSILHALEHGTKEPCLNDLDDLIHSLTAERYRVY